MTSAAHDDDDLQPLTSPTFARDDELEAEPTIDDVTDHGHAGDDPGVTESDSDTSEGEESDDDEFEVGPTYTEIRDGLGVDERGEADAAVAALRRQEDSELFAALVATGFKGKVWDRTSHELARYGIAVIKGWLRTGRISTQLAARNIRVSLTENELRAFAVDRDEREDLANTVAAHALHDFKKRGLNGVGWNPDGGAQITTYFIGACLFAVPNRLRARRADIRSATQPTDTSDSDRMTGQIMQTSGGVGIDPGRQVVSSEEFDRICGQMTVRERNVAALTLGDENLEQAEIARRLDTSVRAVEGVLHRMRNRLVQRMSEKGDDQ